MNETLSLLAKDHGLFLDKGSDALSAIGSGLPGCIFTEADIADDFFNLRNGLAGEVFQKFVNYGFHAAFIIPIQHNHGERVSELIKEHKKHPLIRFFNTNEEALSWLRQE